MRIVQPSTELIRITPDAERAIEEAGRICYQSSHKIEPGSEVKFIERIMKRGHLSVIEHASASFRFICDRGVTHEMVRHRIASFSQESTRFCVYDNAKFGSEITVIKPPGMSKDAEKAWRCAVAEAEHYYFQLLNAGCKAEIARSVLPNCLKTEIVMTANLREWLLVFGLRTSEAAHPQIREIMEVAQGILKKECPTIFAYREV